jgi:starch synthase/alpha-amylase
MANPPGNPRVLIVTPEITYLPWGMGNNAHGLHAKAGGLADVSAALISSLFENGGDIHVAVPDYRAIFNDNISSFFSDALETIKSKVPVERIHLAKDRTFSHIDHVYSSYETENIKIAMTFQREVINNIIPHVLPDLIHCNDWMTGLIPAMAKKLGIPCLFTIHNIHSATSTLADIEENGIDAQSFRQDLFFVNMLSNCEKTRDFIPVDFLASGVSAAHYVNTVSPTFLMEMIQGLNCFVAPPLQKELAGKLDAGCAFGILNAPETSFSPDIDDALPFQYGAKNHAAGKRINKLLLQKRLGIIQDDQAPLFFWPSRLDTIQKGCRLLAEILDKVVLRYWEQNMEIVFVANGEFKKHFNEIVCRLSLRNRVAICDFDEDLSRQAFAASDFVFMPSLFEPCGLPQMIGPIYGALPVAHDTGGLHDTIINMDVPGNTGNGFLFKDFNSNCLLWAIDRAMKFYNLPPKIKQQQIRRVMKQSVGAFDHSVTTQKYIDLYEIMLQRPFIN